MKTGTDDNFSNGRLSVAFISYDEENADRHYAQLQKSFPNAFRISGVEGVANAYKAAADVVNSEFVMTIDADNHFKRNSKSKIARLVLQECVTVFRAYNPVNGLAYGNGGVKIWPTKALRDHPNFTFQDFTMDLSKSLKFGYHRSEIVASIVDIQRSPIMAWRGAFREAAKLFCNARDRFEIAALYRLIAWAQCDTTLPYGDYSRVGALQGIMFASANHRDDVSSFINDFAALGSLFGALPPHEAPEFASYKQSLEKQSSRLLVPE